MAFGETALVGDEHAHRRRRDRRADDARRAVGGRLIEITDADPAACSRLYANLARQLSTWLGRANAQVRALDA